LGTGHSDN